MQNEAAGAQRMGTWLTALYLQSTVHDSENTPAGMQAHRSESAEILLIQFVIELFRLFSGNVQSPFVGVSNTRYKLVCAMQ